ncbi:MAG: TAXI family TRAP transporter solute-binding subunit [Proteobacteria bacterium]|nr:TAXI family TRAP transporter solute-binding subunit [Pseudomonadota bacterium]
MRHFPRLSSRPAIAVIALTAIGLWATPAPALEYFKILSGSRGGTYFPIAGLIGQIISNPPGSKGCEQGGNCGVPGLTAKAETSGGSVANVTALAKGEAQSGFAQSDIAYWAFTGTGPFRNRPAAGDLCAITSLYPEEMHLVRRSGVKIATVSDLKGKRVALGQSGSGALVGGQLLVRAFGLGEGRDFKVEYGSYETAKEMMKNDKIDGLLTIGGYPLQSISELTTNNGARLVPIAGAGADTLTGRSPFYTKVTIPAGTYGGQDTGISTIALSAIWLSRAGLPDDVLYAVTKAFWSNKYARAILDKGHTKGKRILLQSALDGISIPVCNGATKFYREARLMK